MYFSCFNIFAVFPPKSSILKSSDSFVKTCIAADNSGIMTDDYNPQRESRLMSMPVEIRRAIYASVIDDYHIHAFLSEGRIQLSTCLQPNLGDHKHDGHDRKSENISWPKWARRLRSSWGPHWECEELALSENGNLHEQNRNQFYHLLFLSKKM
jgi:hypothetical protein